MREHLRAIEGKRALFRGRFERFDSRTSGGYTVPTLLLLEIKNEQGIMVCDHVWFRQGKQFMALNLQPGDIVQFQATSARYWKGYAEERSVDYCLKFPTKVVKLGEAQTVENLPLFTGIAA